MSTPTCRGLRRADRAADQTAAAGFRNWNDDDDGVLRFDNRAQDIRRELENEHHAWSASKHQPELAAHIGKYNGLFGRLCVIFHCIEHAHDNYIPEIVTEDTAARVAKFMRQFLLPHALAFYSGVLGLADDHDRLAAVAGYILAHRCERLTNRDIQRGCRTCANWSGATPRRCSSNWKRWAG